MYKYKNITRDDIVYQEAGTVSEQDFWFVLLKNVSDLVYLSAYKNNNGYCFWADCVCKKWDHMPTDEEINLVNTYAGERPSDEMGL